MRRSRSSHVAALCALMCTFILPPGARGLPPDAPGPPAARQEGLIRLRFANTDVSDVLQALSLQTRANIVYPAQLKKLISINIRVSTVEEALSYIAAAAGLAWRKVGSTYVVAPSANLREALEPFGTRATLSLSVLSPADAVTLLTGAFPYLTVRAAGNQVLVIGAPEDIAQARALLEEQERARAAEPTVNEVIPMQYASATQVATLLKNMFPALKVDAVGTPDKPGGIIGLSGPVSQVRSARDTLKTVDVPTAPRQPDKIYRVYMIKHSSAPILRDFLEKADPDIAVLIGPETYSPPMPRFNPLSGVSIGTSNTGGAGGGGGLGGGLGGGTGGTGGTGMTGAGGTGYSAGTGGALTEPRPREGDKSKMLVLSGTPAELDAAVTLLDQIDVAPKQVMVEVKVVDTSPERAEQLGMNWSWTRFGFYELPAGTLINPGNGPLGGDFTQFNTRPLSFGALSRVPWSFQSVLNALVTHSEAKILASPRMQVIDNDDANIFIGNTLYTEISQSSIAGTTIQLFQFPIGIILLVRPRINEDGNITMRVHPVVSTITSVDANGLPQTSSREAETTVMVKDGETIVIGGLIQDQITKTVQEVPLLSKLPLVGELFRNRNTDHRHSDVLIFITPHVVK